MIEQHPWEFRNQTVPARLCYLLQQGEINVTDLLLSFVIDSLIRSQGNQNGFGCRASDLYLGKATGVCRSYVAARIRQLADLGMLIICHLNGKRYIEMEWSRTAEERHALAGEYGKVFRKAYAQMKFKLDSRRESTKQDSDNRDESVKQDWRESTKQDTEYNEERGVSNCRPPKADGIVNELPIKTNSDRSQQGQVFAEELYQLLLEKRKIVPRQYNSSAWSRRFIQAIQERGWDMCRSSLDKYREHFGKQYMLKVYAANTFCDNIPRILDLAESIEQQAKPKTKKVYSHTINVRQPDGTTRPQTVYKDEVV